MRMTPLDIRNQRFRSRLRGYDPSEVDTFIQMVAGDYESLVREADTLRERVRGLELRLEELTAQEKTLQETLVTAQSVASDVKQTAIRESEVMISEAEVKAERVVHAAHRQVARLAEDIRELKILRARVAEAVRSTLQTHMALLDSLAAEPQDDLPRGEIKHPSPALPIGSGA